MKAKQRELHPDARAVINVAIETASVLREPKIDVIFSGPVLRVAVVATDLTRRCKVTSPGVEAMRMSFRKETVPQGSIISLTVYSEDEVHVETVRTTGYTVH